MILFRWYWYVVCESGMRVLDSCSGQPLEVHLKRRKEVAVFTSAHSLQEFTEQPMEGQPPDASVAGPPVRGPPCVALASAQCRASPSRSCHYTPVPDAYRAEHQLDDDACVCSSNLCHRMVGLMAPAGQPGRPRKKRGHGQESPLADVSGRAPSPSARQQPALVIDIFQIKAVRRTAIDSETRLSSLSARLRGYAKSSAGMGPCPAWKDADWLSNLRPYTCACEWLSDARHRLQVAVDPVQKKLLLRGQHRRLEHKFGGVPHASGSGRWGAHGQCDQQQR